MAVSAPTPAPAPNRCLSPSDAAAYVSLSPKTLEVYRTRGGGPAYVKLGRRVAYRLADLDAWVSARVQSNTGGRAAA